MFIILFFANKKFSAPILWEWPRAESVALFLNRISLCLDALSPMLFQFAYLLKIEAFILVPQVLINRIYDAFIASRILTTKVGLQFWQTVRSPKGLNLDSKGDEEGPRSCM